MNKLHTLNQIQVPVQIVLGERTLNLDELTVLGPGAIVEFPVLAGEPVSLVAAGEVVAKGEVVVIDENFGIRITEMVSAPEGDLPWVAD